MSTRLLEFAERAGSLSRGLCGRIVDRAPTPHEGLAAADREVQHPLVTRLPHERIPERPFHRVCSAVRGRSERRPFVSDRILLGLGKHLIQVPRVVWQPLLRASARRARASLSFFSSDHHRVRDFVVRELPRIGAPLGPGAIAEGLELGLPRVREILDELEAGKIFLFRGDGETVTWAYPVTVEETPHAVRFGTGEEAYSP